MNTGINFWVILRRLRHTEQPIDFRHDPRQGAAGTQRLEHARRLRFHQATRQFLPDALRHQMIDFAAIDHLTHQRQGFGGNGEIGKTRHETRHAQNPDRVFNECGADMTKYACLNIAATAVRIDQFAGIGLGNGVDGEVAPGEILFQRDLRCGADFKSFITPGGLALGAGKRVFIMRNGV